MAAKSKPVDEVTAADLGVDASQVGWAGARQQITSIEAAASREAGEVVEDDGTGFEKIVAYLDNLKVL
jgi:electron transfer flavoprotein beta subunit